MAWWRKTEPLPPPPSRVLKTAEERAAEHEAGRASWEQQNPLLTYRIARVGGVVSDIRGHSYVTHYARHVRVYRSVFRWGVYPDSWGNDRRGRGIVVYEAFDAMSIELVEE